MTNDSGFLTSHQDLSGYIPKSGGQVLTGTEYLRTVNDSKLVFSSGTSSSNGGVLDIYGKDHASYPGWVSLKAQDSSYYSQMTMRPDGVFTFNNNGIGKNLAMAEDVIPRSGGAVMTGDNISRSTDKGILSIRGGTAYQKGAQISMYGKDYTDYAPYAGYCRIWVSNGTSIKEMNMTPDGTWTWNGTAVQIISDQRLKQQISNIDDKLLDAWKDVEPVQFKYNDAVDQKGDKARLHTGYVVQQIDEACKSHDVDISEYGLYCHEEYPERTEEVTIENEDGTTSKETKVIEPAKEHYSLRYTETLVVECAYLRRENAKLKEQLQNHEDYLKLVEEHLHLKNL